MDINVRMNGAHGSTEAVRIPHLGQPTPFKRSTFEYFFHNQNSNSNTAVSQATEKDSKTDNHNSNAKSSDSKTAPVDPEQPSTSEMSSKCDSIRGATCVQCKACYQDPCTLRCGHTLCRPCLTLVTTQLGVGPAKRVSCPDCHREHVYTTSELESLSKMSTTPAAMLIGSFRNTSEGRLGTALVVTQKGHHDNKVAEIDGKEKVACSECDYECPAESRALWFCRRCQVPICCTCVFARHKRHLVVPFCQFYRESRRVLGEVTDASRIKQSETKVVSKHMTDLLQQGIEQIRSRESNLVSRLDSISGRLHDDNIMSTRELHDMYSGLIMLDKDTDAFKNVLNKDVPLDKWLKLISNSSDSNSDIAIPVQLCDATGGDDDDRSTTNSFVAMLMHQDRVPAPKMNKDTARTKATAPLPSAPLMKSKSLSLVMTPRARSSSVASQTIDCKGGDAPMVKSIMVGAEKGRKGQAPHVGPPGFTPTTRRRSMFGSFSDGSSCCSSNPNGRPGSRQAGTQTPLPVLTGFGNDRRSSYGSGTTRSPQPAMFRHDNPILCLTDDKTSLRDKMTAMLCGAGGYARGRRRGCMSPQMHARGQMGGRKAGGRKGGASLSRFRRV